MSEKSGEEYLALMCALILLKLWSSWRVAKTFDCFVQGLRRAVDVVPTGIDSIDDFRRGCERYTNENGSFGVACHPPRLASAQWLQLL